jgi:hypothetical protein
MSENASFLPVFASGLVVSWLSRVHHRIHGHTTFENEPIFAHESLLSISGVVFVNTKSSALPPSA